MNFRIACQTISWGDKQHERFPAVFAEIAAAGFTGVEIGYRRLEQAAVADMRRFLADAGLELVASHIGGNLSDQAQARGEWDALDRVLDRLAELKAGRLMFSGLRHQGDNEKFARELDTYLRASEHCRERGVELLYHNHDWEFLNGGKVFAALNAAAAARFCPDVGWFLKGQVGARATLDRLNGRLGAVHFKDFATAAPGVVDPLPLGEGIAPLAEAAAWLREHVTKPMWVIAEQDATTLPTAEMARRNAEFLGSAFLSRQRA